MMGDEYEQNATHDKKDGNLELHTDVPLPNESFHCENEALESQHVPTLEKRCKEPSFKSHRGPSDDEKNITDFSFASFGDEPMAEPDIMDIEEESEYDDSVRAGSMSSFASNGGRRPSVLSDEDLKDLLGWEEMAQSKTGDDSFRRPKGTHANLEMRWSISCGRRRSQNRVERGIETKISDVLIATGDEKPKFKNDDEFQAYVRRHIAELRSQQKAGIKDENGDFIRRHTVDAVHRLKRGTGVTAASLNQKRL